MLPRTHPSAQHQAADSPSRPSSWSRAPWSEHRIRRRPPPCPANPQVSDSVRDTVRGRKKKNKLSVGFSFVARLAGDVVGMGEMRVRSHVQRQGEITYIVHPRVWGQGIGTEIGRQLLSYGFGELESSTEFMPRVIRGTSALPRYWPDLA
ncbi:GNAT family N-acetyltransferase [Streptomyces sp. NPDC020747]|uniref:GNAT family N-acetyltransferase n=1 Tax=Streptomyces sp. NPDC020747 TaxID=3365086 RepID=UPI0037A64DC2